MTQPKITFNWHKCECGCLYSPLAVERYYGECLRCGKALSGKANVSYSVYIGDEVKISNKVEK